VRGVADRSLAVSVLRLDLRECRERWTLVGESLERRTGC
jgi:hypothetical protein